MSSLVLRMVATTAAAGLAALLPSAPAAQAAGGRPFHLELSGANEFNGSGAPINPHGDADRATMTLTLNPGAQQVCWSVDSLTLTAGEALPHASHIHVAPAGVAGPVVVDLFAGNPPTAYPTDTRCVTAARATVLDILRDPAAYYVNLHNVQHPGGVVRSQIG